MSPRLVEFRLTDKPEYGQRWTDLVAAKRTYDPSGLLARGQQISAALLTADGYALRPGLRELAAADTPCGATGATR